MQCEVQGSHHKTGGLGSPEELAGGGVSRGQGRAGGEGELPQVGVRRSKGRGSETVGGGKK